MKILFINSSSAVFKEVKISSRPLGISEQSECLGDQSFKNVALGLLCVEDVDTKFDANKIIDEIQKYSQLVSREIVLIPFAHLSSNLAKPQAALTIINYVRSKLKEAKILAGSVSFGTHKKLKLERLITEAHPGDIAFRDSNFSTNKSLSEKVFEMDCIGGDSR